MNSQNREILNLTQEAAVLVRGGTICYMNPPAERLLGRTLLSRPLTEVLGCELSVASGGALTADLPIGGRYYIVRFHPLGDTTAVFFTEPQLREELVSDAYLHAMRTTLMNLRLAIQQTVHALGFPVMSPPMVQCERQYFKLNRMLSNTAAVHGLCRGTLPLVLGPLDLTLLVGNTVDTMHLLMPELAISFRCSEPIHLWADGNLVESLLLNLVSNAMRHAEGMTRLELELKAERERVVLTVGDNGCGIAPPQMTSVFSRYLAGFQLSEMDAGAGLGLTVARGIARLHEGTLLLSSRPGGGTTVQVSFSRTLGAESSLRESASSYEPRMDALLTGLAEVLPDDSFRLNLEETYLLD